MALNAYVSQVRGEKQGQFRQTQSRPVGASRAEPVDTAKPFRADAFEAGGTQSSASGQATGKRTHMPIRSRGYY